MSTKRTIVLPNTCVCAHTRLPVPILVGAPNNGHQNINVYQSQYFFLQLTPVSPGEVGKRKTERQRVRDLANSQDKSASRQKYSHFLIH